MASGDHMTMCAAGCKHITHPKDSPRLKQFGTLVQWAKDPFDDYLWVVLVNRDDAHTPWVVWTYNGADPGGGCSSGNYCEGEQYAREEFKRRVLSRLPVKWRKEFVT